MESSPADSDQRLKEKWLPETTYWKSFMETINVLSRSSIASDTPTGDNLDTEFDANECIIESYKRQAHDNLAVLLFTLELLEMQKYDQFCPLILCTNASDSNSGFYAEEDALLRRRHTMIPRFQQIFIPLSFRKRPGMMAYHRK